MILRINPNRMELLRLRRRLTLAQRGHKLLQDKLEEMLRRFLLLIRDIDEAKANFQASTRRIIQDLLYCRMSSSQNDFKETLAKINTQVQIDVSTMRLLNLQVPLLHLTALKIDKQYNFFTTSAQMDLVLAGARDYLESVLRLGQLLKTLDILSAEIERTRRRVNALEYLVIPAIKETIRYITQKLNEFERANLVRLERVKELVRSH